MADKQIKGIMLPFQIGESSFPAEANGEDGALASLNNLFSTVKSERVMRPDFGILAHHMVFDNLTSIRKVQIANDIKDAVAKYVKKVVLVSVLVEQGQNQGEAIVTITYELAGKIGQQRYSFGGR